MTPRYNGSSYRGRRSAAKTALVIFLVLVILAAVSVILLQRYVVYDEVGSPRIELPWQKETEEQEMPPLDLIIEEGKKSPEDPQKPPKQTMPEETN